MAEDDYDDDDQDTDEPLSSQVLRHAHGHLKALSGTLRDHLGMIEHKRLGAYAKELTDDLDAIADHVAVTHAEHHPSAVPLGDDPGSVSGDEAEEEEMRSGQKSLPLQETECISCQMVIDDLMERVEAKELATAVLETVEGAREIEHGIKSLGVEVDALIADDQAVRFRALLTQGKEFEIREVLDKTCARCGGKPVWLLRCDDDE